MDNNLPMDVQLQYMRPAQFEAAARKFPVAYVPFGPIEWHGRHLPLGNDTVKAHAVLVKTAERFGGVVHPPVYFHDGFNQEHMQPVITELFDRLKKTGFRVIIGVSGHNVQSMITMINSAMEPVLADGECAGVGLWEMTLSQCDDSSSDHAAKWETSNVMFLHPELVDMDTLGTEPITLDMSPPHGIGGLDPREHASAEVGRLNIELCSEAIGIKARELLQSLPVEKRDFNIDKIEPGSWWMV
jgi:creatinine amidohydrolase